jgi:serine/threonine protein kinase
MDSQELYQKAKEIFYAALDLPSTERTNYISNACQNNQELIKEVESLLLVEEDDEEFFDAIQKQLAVQVANSFLKKKASLVGSKLRNRYLILKEFVTNGLENFYLAEDQENLKKHVLVKIFPKTSYLTESFNEGEFFKEATVLAQLKHPQINQPINFGRSFNGDIFVVVELFPTSTLRSKINEKIFVNDLSLASKVILQLGEILNFIHSQGVYHSNLQPENIVFKEGKNDNPQTILVTNFGFTTLKIFSEEITQLVLPCDCNYLAPEQLINKTSKASDIFALGLIAYEMLTGINPVALETTSETSLIEYAYLREKQKILPPNELNPLISKQASEIIMQALAYNAKLRPSQGKKFCLELASLLGLPSQSENKLTNIKSQELGQELVQELSQKLPQQSSQELPSHLILSTTPFLKNLEKEETQEKIQEKIQEKVQEEVQEKPYGKEKLDNKKESSENIEKMLNESVIITATEKNFTAKILFVLIIVAIIFLVVAKLLT